MSTPSYMYLCKRLQNLGGRYQMNRLKSLCHRRFETLPLRLQQMTYQAQSRGYRLYGEVECIRYSGANCVTIRPIFVKLEFLCAAMVVAREYDLDQQGIGGRRWRTRIRFKIQGYRQQYLVQSEYGAGIRKRAGVEATLASFRSIIEASKESDLTTSQKDASEASSRHCEFTNRVEICRKAIGDCMKYIYHISQQRLVGDLHA